MKKMKNQNDFFHKNVIWNIIGTTTNAFTSLIYMIIVTRINGLETAGIFSFSFSNAGVLFVIGMYMGRTYQVSDTNHSQKAFRQVRLLTCVVMFAVSLIMAYIYNYTAETLIIFLLWVVFKMIDAYVDVLYGVLQQKDRLYCVGISLTSKAIAGVFIFVMIDIITKNVALSSIGAVLVNILIVIGYDIPHYRKYVNQDESNKNEIIYLLKDGFYIFGTTLLSSYLVNASKYALNSYGNNKDQAVFGIIIMPATVMVLAGQYLIHPYLMKLTLLFRKREFAILTNLVKKILIILIGIGVIGIMAAYLIGIPFLEIIYGTELSSYKMELIIVIIGAICYGIVSILINVLTVMHSNKIQLLGFSVNTLITYLIAGQLVLSRGVRGAAMAYFVSMAILCGFFIIITGRKIKKEMTDESIHNYTCI